MRDTIIIGDKVKILNVDRKLLTHKMYGWSKWGGTNFGLVQEELTPIWSCQACREQQTDQLPPYMFEFSPREFMRICSQCHFLRLKLHLESLVALLEAVRKIHGTWDSLLE